MEADSETTVDRSGRRTCHRAATIAVCSLAIGLIGMGASMVLFRLIPEMWVSVIWNVGALCMLPSLICGVVAMTGIRRFGTRGLLWKGIVSVSIPLTLYAATLILTAGSR